MPILFVIPFTILISVQFRIRQWWMYVHIFVSDATFFLCCFIGSFFPTVFISFECDLMRYTESQFRCCLHWIAREYFINASIVINVCYNTVVTFVVVIRFLFPLCLTFDPSGWFFFFLATEHSTWSEVFASFSTYAPYLFRYELHGVSRFFFSSLHWKTIH